MTVRIRSPYEDRHANSRQLRVCLTRYTTGLRTLIGMEEVWSGDGGREAGSDWLHVRTLSMTHEGSTYLPKAMTTRRARTGKDTAGCW